MQYIFNNSHILIIFATFMITKCKMSIPLILAVEGLRPNNATYLSYL